MVEVEAANGRGMAEEKLFLLIILNIHRNQSCTWGENNSWFVMVSRPLKVETFVSRISNDMLQF
jgi:hypothetical protein